MRTSRRRRTLWAPWHLLSWSLGLLVLLMGVSVLAEGTGSDLVVGAALTVLGIPLVLRFPFLRVTLTPDGVVDHGFFRNRKVPWASISSVTLTDTDGIVFSAKAPTLCLREGEDVVLTNLAGYSTSVRVDSSRMARQVVLIQGELAEATPS